MTHVIMFALGAFIFILTRRFFYKNIELFICLLIPVNFEFFHLVPRVGQFDNYQEALLIVIFLHLLEYFLLRPIVRGKTNKPQQGIVFGYFVYAYLVLVIIGSITSLFSGQPLELALMATKGHFTILVFFLIAYRDFDFYKFFNYLFITVGILGLILIIQYAVFDYVKIFYFYKDTDTHIRDLNELRGLRLLEGVELIGICAVAAFSFYIQNSKKRYLFAFLFFFFLIIFVAKYRMYIAAIPPACLIIFILFKGFHPKVFLLLFSILFILPLTTIVLINTPTVQEHALVQSMAKDFSGIGSGEGNIDIRFKAYEYYFTETLKNPWLGRGVLNNNWEGNSTGDLIKDFGIFLSDIGIFHIFVNFGLIGVGYFLLLFATIFRFAIKYKLQLAIVSYFIFGLVFCFEIDIFFYKYLLFILGIFLGLIERDLIVKRNNLKLRTAV